MGKQYLFCTLLLFTLSPKAYSQSKRVERAKKSLKDSLYISETEDKPGPPKVLHAEPLFNDLARDLGARKGEQEINMTLGLSDHLKYNTYETSIQYAFAPINRLGIEVKVPFTFNVRAKGVTDSVPGSHDDFNFSLQWTCFVSEKLKTSMALGYTNKTIFADFNRYRSDLFVHSNQYNPFFIIAKRWGKNFHTMVYTGPTFEQDFRNGQWDFSYQINTSFHYMIPGTRHFVGIELNKDIVDKQFEMVVRPQLRVEITKNFLVGIAAGVPVNIDDERFSAFVRLVYEPPQPKKKKK